MRRAVLLAIPIAAVAFIGACRQSLELPFSRPPELWGNGESDLFVSDVVRPNTCVPLTDASGHIAHVAGQAFPVGTRVLMLETQGPLVAGSWAAMRVAYVTSSTMVFDSLIPGSFATAGAESAQICDIPEYRVLEVGSAQTLAAQPWSNGVGGVLAIAARRVRVLSGGSITASGIGFAGGACSPPTAVDVNVGPDDPATPGFAGAKGEGIEAGSNQRIGRAAAANAGGGGNASQAGGGGGGNGGGGGMGGFAAGVSDPQDSAGAGGGAVAAATPLLVIGGGGGGGQRRTNTDPDGGYCMGGWGGGIVFVLASSLEGSGSIEARGGVAGIPTAGGGGSGGGAGGTIFVDARIAEGFLGVLDASGGPGGDAVVGTAGAGGPGGGGAGGRIYTDAPIATDLDGGRAGDTEGAALGAHGATQGTSGILSSTSTETIDP